MSSSMFIEPAVQLKPEDEDANLVVVYGKKTGVNIDPEDLEKLIEKKTVQSISVIRLTSPTPSMEDAEEAERLEAEKNAQESATDDSDEQTDAEANESKRNDGNAESTVEKSGTESEGDDSDMSAEGHTRDEDSSEHEASLFKKRKTKRQQKKLKVKSKAKTATPEAKPRAELVGLTFEGFYQAEAALEIAKEACKMAGISYIRNTAEHEALVLVIKNDHCYTPFTSPEQMKAKILSDKLEAEKIAANARKVQPPMTVQAKQVMLLKSRKPQIGVATTQVATKPGLKKPIEGVKALRASADKSPQDVDANSSLNSTDDFDEDEETYELIDVDSDYSASEQSDESDNDRDSDLDFDVNNRQLKKRKVPLHQKKLRKLATLKHGLDKRPMEERPMPSNAAVATQRPVFAAKPRIGTVNVNIGQRQVQRPLQTMAVEMSPKTPGSSTAQAGMQKVVVNKLFARPAITITPKLQQKPTQVTQIPAAAASQSANAPTETSFKRVVNVPKGDAMLQSPKQNVKEIVLNKVMSSPKGGFTELSTLISAEESTQKQQEIPVAASKPTILSNIIIAAGSSVGNAAATTSRGFTRIDAASKNQLPAQISIETHHSSNELAAEHDKQLDLIDSIVKDELNKSLEEEIVEKPSIGINENIPKLVEMLENTEKALVSSSKTTTVTTAAASHVDDIDITHGLPEDLLQHVVELIEDDKTLKEAVEKQILEEQSFRNDTGVVDSHTSADVQQQQQKASSSAGNVAIADTTGFTTMPHTVHLIQPMPSASITQPTATKSIIQMSISNISSPMQVIQTSSPSYTPKSSPLTRRDPIQIVRGNGRVITLPPIEAPTTRAKRRAQVTPSTPGQTQNLTDQSSIAIFNESSLDSSMHSNASFSAVMPTTTTPGILTMTTANLNETFGSAATTTIEKKQQQRRASKEDKISKKATTTKASAKKAAMTAILQQEDADASESQGDDDDPDKLWCICRQPHNNRFMICCDACGDWFHGKCVNITKAMGREMEQKGKEWTCPLCKKKQEDKQQRKLTDMLPVKRSNSQSSTGDKLKQQQNLLKPLSTEAVTSTTTITTASITNVVEPVTAAIAGSNKDIAGLSKKPGTSQFVIVQTPPISATKKTAVSRDESQAAKKFPTGKAVGQSKIKLLTTTPVRATNVQVKTPQSSRSADSSFSHKTTPTATPRKVVHIPAVPCVVCKKSARPGTVYCSDDCIRRSAQNAINVITAKMAEQNAAGSSGASLLDEKKKKPKGLFEDLLAMPDRKPKIERITVYERKTGTKLSGANAPTTVTIKKWLHDNPTFEIVLPGSQLSLEIEQKQQQQRSTMIQKATEAAAMRAHIGGSPHDKANLKLTKTSPITGEPMMGGQTLQKLNSPQAVKVQKPTSSEEQKQLSQRATTPRQLQKQQQQQTHSKTAKDEPSKTKERQQQQLKRQSSESSAAGSGSNPKRRTAESSTAGSSGSSSTTTTDSEPIRMNVRRTLKNEILQRMRESANAGTDEAKLSAEEVEAFVKQTETEMYNYFNRDTGQKYRNKYRSLMFNIKDRKNRTLFAKICAKQLEPKQLVHMSGAELASQELAKWREEENKHQLEMIKKSELEMLSCTKNYLFKNHKGEEVIESKETDVCVNLDITTPVEDLVNVLNSSTAGMSSFENDVGNESSIGNLFESSSPAKQHSSLSISDDTSPPQAEQEHSQQHHHHHHHHQHHHEERNKSRRDSEKEHRSKSRERERDRHKDETEKERERERRERRHRSRSRDRERDKQRHHRDKSRSRRRSHSRSKSRSRSQERRHKSATTTQHRERERDEKERKKTGADHKTLASSTTTTTTVTSTPKPHTTNVIQQLQHKDKQRHSPTVVATKQKLLKQPTTLECFNLIDQIIESSKTVEEAANLVKDSNKEKPKEKPKIETTTTTPQASSSTQEAAAAVSVVPPKRVLSTSDSDQEPTSTVSIPTPPRDEPSFSRTNSPTDFETQTLWSGLISMNEVATLQINIQQLIGNSSNVGNLLPSSTLDVVGRIDNETVWEYLWKIRKSPNKEIVLIRLMPLSDDDIDGYAKLFSYLDQKKRLGVVKSSTPQIKDFYIFPLGSGKQLPKVLQVTSEHSFYTDAYRADVIVGILVCVTGKRGSATTSASSTPHVSSSAHFGSSVTAKHSRHRHRPEATDSFTPPGSPKRKKRVHKTDIDLDAIVKTPIVRKPATATTSAAIDDADEPYSPGGSSDDDLVSMYAARAQPTVLLGLASADEELKRKMEEINRQIAAQEIEIAGLLNAETTGASASVLANISIPSNLPQILASINKSKETPTSSAAARIHMESSQAASTSTAFEEYNPEAALLATKTATTTYTANASAKQNPPTSSTSRLAQLSEAELLSMVPDDVLMEPATQQPPPYYNEPPPPGV